MTGPDHTTIIILIFDHLLHSLSVHLAMSVTNFEPSDRCGHTWYVTLILISAETVCQFEVHFEIPDI